MTPLVQARISWAIKLIGVLVTVGGIIAAAWTALNTTGIFTPVTIALFILLSLVALITALQEFIKVDPLTEIIPGDAGIQAQATATATLDELHQLLLEIKGMVTSLPQPQASVSITTPASPTATDSTTITATAGDTTPTPPPDAQANADRLAAVTAGMPPITVTPDSTLDAIVPAPQAEDAPVSTPAVEPAKFVTDDAGVRYQLVPVPSVL